MTSGPKRKASALPDGLQLQNRFTVLKVEAAPAVPSTRGPHDHTDHQEKDTWKKSSEFIFPSRIPWPCLLSMGAALRRFVC